MTTQLLTVIIWLSINCFHECRQEPLAGQIAVAQVVLNRAEKCGSTPKEAIMLDRQFSWVNNPQNKRVMFDPIGEPEKVDEFMQCAASSLLASFVPDLTGGATHYHATYIKKPSWAKGMKKVAQIGNHVFYTDGAFRCK